MAKISYKKKYEELLKSLQKVAEAKKGFRKARMADVLAEIGLIHQTPQAKVNWRR